MKRVMILLVILASSIAAQVEYSDGQGRSEISRFISTLQITTVKWTDNQE